MDKSGLIKQCKESYGKNVRLQHLLAIINGKTFEKAVELGCNEGYLLHNVSARKKVGYDINPKEIFGDVEYKEMNIMNLEQDDADLVICSEVIEHIENDLEAMNILYNQLREGGLLYLTTINRNIRADKSLQDKERGHIRRYGPELKELLERTGFQTLRFYPIRSSHYYAHKRDLSSYLRTVDEAKGKEEASGWVYTGTKK